MSNSKFLRRESKSSSESPPILKERKIRTTFEWNRIKEFVSENEAKEHLKNIAADEGCSGFGLDYGSAARGCKVFRCKSVKLSSTQVIND